MAANAKDLGIVSCSVNELPVLAAPVLEKLGYSVTRASKHLEEMLAVDRFEEQLGLDWWRHEYRVILEWKPASNGEAIVYVDITEKKGGGSKQDCQRRCDDILLRLQEAAQRAQEVAGRHEKSTAHGSARWGNEGELRAADYLQPRADAARLLIGKSNDDKQYISVPERSTYCHAIVCGRTGVGKSTGFFIPNIIERTGASMIVTEATPGFELGDLYKKTAGWRKLAGHQIYTFNPADRASTRINPIDAVRRAPDDFKKSTAQKLAGLIISNGPPESKLEQPWDESEKALLSALILHAAATDTEYGHMGAVRWLLLSGLYETKKVLAKSPSEHAQFEFDGWLNTTDTDAFRYSVLGGLMAKLNPWMSDQLVALTSTTDIDLDALKDQLFTIYLAMPSRWSESKIIGALTLNFLINHLVDLRPTMKYPLALLLDEFTNFGKVPDIADILAIIRKNRVGLVLGFQNYFQLEQAYSRKEAQIIMDMPATQVFFRCKTFREARELSDALGNITIEELKVNDTGRVQEFITGRELATPEELMNLRGEVIIFTNDTWPIRAPLIAPTAYEAALAYPPPQAEEKPISEFIRKHGRTARKQQEQLESEIEDSKAEETAQSERKRTRKKDQGNGKGKQTNDGGGRPDFNQPPESAI